MHWQQHNGRGFRRTGLRFAIRLRNGEELATNAGQNGVTWDWHWRADNPCPRDVIAYALLEPKQ